MKIQKKKYFFLWGGGGGGQAGGQAGVGLVGGFRVDVNAMLGVGGDVGYGDVNQEYKVLYNVHKGIVQY